MFSSAIFRGILITIVVLLLVLVSTAAFFLQGEIKKSANLSEQLIYTQKEQLIFKSSLEDSKEEVSRLNILITESHGQAKQLDSEISTLEEDNKRLNREISTLKENISFTNEKNIGLSKKIDDLETKFANKEKQLVSAVKEKEDLRVKLEDFKKERGPINLEKIVVKPQLEGKIVNIDKRLKFLVIDRGIQDDVAVGDVFSCFLNGKEIGQVKVEKVYDSLSAANFLSNLKFKYVKEGAKVLRR